MTLLNPLEKQRRAASETRRLGLGVMGIADMLNQLGKTYDGDEAVTVLERVMETIANAAYQSSAQLAEEKGASPIFSYEEYARCPFFQEALNDETRALIRTQRAAEYRHPLHRTDGKHLEYRAGV